MKKIAEKVAVVALICIALVFVLTAVLYITGTINNYNTTDLYDREGQIIQMSDNSIILTLMVVLAIVYAALAVFVLYMNFSSRENLRSILLFCDSDSATRTKMKVIDNIVKGCSQQVEGIKVRKIRVRSDEKGGFAATVSVKVNAAQVAENVNTLRCLLVDSFKNTLNLTFNTINFQIDKLNGRYVPDIEKAEKQAEDLQEKQETVIENYHQPLETEAANNSAAETAEPATDKNETATETEKQLEPQD